MDLLRRFTADTRGATAIEYALIAGVITTVLVAALSPIGANLSAKLRAASNGLR